MKKLSLYVFLVLLFFPEKLYAKTFSWKDYTSNVKKMQIKSKNKKIGTVIPNVEFIIMWGWNRNSEAPI